MAAANAENTYQPRGSKEPMVIESTEAGAILSASEWAELDNVARIGFTANDQRDMRRMGKKQEFRASLRRFVVTRTSS